MSLSGQGEFTGGSESAASFHTRHFPRAARHQTLRATRRTTRLKARGLHKNKGFLNRRRGRLTTRGLVDDYLTLCRNPMKDLRRWVGETNPTSRTRSSRTTLASTTPHAQNPSSRLALRADGFRDHPLHEMRSRLDTARHGWSDRHPLPSRPGAGADGYDRLRPLPAAGGASGAHVSGGEGAEGQVAPAASLSSELGAARSYYASRIAVARQSLRPSELAAAIRAIKDQQTLAIRSIIDRWQVYFQNRKQNTPFGPGRPAGAPPLLRYSGLRKS